MILFLDIDGVLVNYSVVADRDKFYAPAVAALNYLHSMLHCAIVVTSCWRIGRSVEDLDRLFAHNGVSIRVIDKTEATKINGCRGQEILDWVAQNVYAGDYIVIDDEIGDIASFISNGKIIYVENGLMKDGLTKEHIQEFISRREYLITEPTKRRSKMCAPQDFSAIETAVDELVHLHKTFTGEDVHKRIHNKHIRRNVDLSGCPESPKGVSREVRKMFNARHPSFATYGSTLVPHNKGPVLYFSLPHHAKAQADKIAKKLN